MNGADEAKPRETADDKQDPGECYGQDDGPAVSSL